MTPIVIAVLVVVVVLAVVFLARRSRPSEDGVASFRRHIDELSPEARREVIERVQQARENGKGK